MNFLFLLKQFILIQFISAISKDEDYYSSLTGIQKLARTEVYIVSLLIDYKQNLIRRLNLIDSYIKEFEETLSNDFKSKSAWRPPPFDNEDDLLHYGKFVSANPVLGYKLIRRFSKDLPNVMSALKVEIGKDIFKYMTDLPERLKIPDEVDLSGAADGLIRIQDFYEITINNLLELDFERKTKLTLKTFDYHYIGMRAWEKDYARAIDWLQTGINSEYPYENETIKADLLNTIDLHNKAWVDSNGSSPWNTLFSKPIDLTEWKIKQNKKPKSSNYITGYTEERIDDIINFHAVCRGEQFGKLQKSLYCFYKRDTFWTTIAPFKIEVISNDPQILQIYDVLEDNVIEKIINVASHSLKRGLIYGTPDEMFVKSELRTSSVTWMNEGINELISKVPKLIKQFTGLDSKCSELLQISSYGSIGGHYHPHLDAFFNPNHNKTIFDQMLGDRISTVMFYLSDVEKGGGTGFPRLGVVTKPVKGSAVFWHNLKRNGDVDPLMFHGGCPVLLGNKWVANKWIRSHGQMFLRKCSLNGTE